MNFERYDERLQSYSRGFDSTQAQGAAQSAHCRGRRLWIIVYTTIYIL